MDGCPSNKPDGGPRKNPKATDGAAVGRAPHGARARRTESRHALRDERAIVLPATMAILFAVIAIAAAAVQAAVVSNHQSFRDGNVKRAFGAATAGVHAAIYELNMLQPTSNQCVHKDQLTDALTNVTVQSDGWCAPETETLGDNESYSVQVSSATNITDDGQQLDQRKVVSTGAANGVQRRVEVTLSSLTGRPLFADGYAIVSDDPLDIKNDVQVNGAIGSNGSITLNNNVQICGNATFGSGQRITFNNNAHLCSSYSSGPATQRFPLNQIDFGNVSTVNDNSRIGNQDPWTSPSRISWNPATRVLQLSGSSTLTLTGSVYSFCKLVLSNNAVLKIGLRDPGTSVRIYIDSPEHCGGSSYGSVEFQNNSGLINLNSVPSTLQLYVAGSPTIATHVDFSNNFSSAVSMTIWAPLSSVNITNNAHIVGAINAKTVNLSNNAVVDYNAGAATLRTSSVFRVYKRQSWIDCSAQPSGSAPDSGC